MANGVWNAKENLVSVITLRLLLRKVRDAGCVVEFEHVKGHTADAGVDTSQAVLMNGRADDLASVVRQGPGAVLSCTRGGGGRLRLGRQLTSRREWRRGRLRRRRAGDA